MIDPLSIAVNALAGKAATKVIDSLAEEKLQLVSPGSISNDTLHAITDPKDDETLAIVTESQLREIEDFLESEEVSQLLGAWCALMISKTDGSPELVNYELPHAFDEIAHSYNSNTSSEEKWSSLSPELWNLLTSGVSHLIPRLEASVSQDRSAQKLLERYSTGARLLRGITPTSGHASSVAKIISDPQRMITALDAVHEICRATSSAYADMTLSHSHEEYRIDQTELYVERSLAVIEAKYAESDDLEAEKDSSDLINSRLPARSVVIGDPGVGKSTLVKHLVHHLGKNSEQRLAPILVVSKDYVATAWDSSITDYISTFLNVEYDLRLPAEVIPDVFSLGNACVIFDGIDEIVDITFRRKLIARIEALAQRYPAISVICTSRKVGYRKAAFGPVFQLFHLNEFSNQQVVEYVNKWFKLERWQESDQRAFLYEIKTLLDIASNPLMLSLLCTLYRARGFIPRNRRHVYRNCAELLFQRWDSMRHIEQPYDHRQYGERLMQELARFFFTTPSTHSGVAENQLEGIISHFFIDTGSVDEIEAKHRAKQFLDFCAGRAWLLTYKGTTDRGVRLFGFTHRTFMEYLAAESVVRIAPDIKDIAAQVLRSFEQDESSVMPDVMVQAADEKFDKGAEQVLKQLLQDGRRKASVYGDKFLHLCLRIVNSSPMSRNVIDFLPKEIVTYWSRVGSLRGTFESTLALFGLFSDARTRIIRSLSATHVDAADDSLDHIYKLRYGICQRWARIFGGEHYEILDHDWSQDLDTYFQDVVINPGRYIGSRFRSIDPHESNIDPAVADYLLSRGLADPGFTDTGVYLQPLFYITGFGEVIAGSLVHALEEIFFTGNFSGSGKHDRCLRKVRQWLAVNKVGFKALSSEESDRIRKILRDRTPGYAHRARHLDVETYFRDNPEDATIVTWINMLSWEAQGGPHAFHRLTEGIDQLPDIATLGEVRESAKYRRVRKSMPEVEGQREAPYSELLRPWIAGKNVIID